MTIYSKDGTPRADMYLPAFLLGFGFFLDAMSVAFGVALVVTQKWGFAIPFVLLLALGVCAYLCWKNQKIVMIDDDYFEYTTMFGKTTRYAFSEIRSLRFNPDSITMFVGEGKVHIESMAIMTPRLFERIECAMDKGEE